MGAFVGAVEAGAHAIEMDIHLSSDGVVVLSHVSLALNVAISSRLQILISCRILHSNVALGRKIG